MYKEEQGMTSKRGKKEIDHIFSNIKPTNSYKDDFLITNNIADHSIIGYDFALNGNINGKSFTIPNMNFHEKMLHMMINNPETPFL